jgi:hypothetical protein
MIIIPLVYIHLWLNNMRLDNCLIIQNELLTLYNKKIKNSLYNQWKALSIFAGNFKNVVEI